MLNWRLSGATTNTGECSLCFHPGPLGVGFPDEGLRVFATLEDQPEMARPLKALCEGTRCQILTRKRVGLKCRSGQAEGH